MPGIIKSSCSDDLGIRPPCTLPGIFNIVRNQLDTSTRGVRSRISFDHEPGYSESTGMPSSSRSERGNADEGGVACRMDHLREPRNSAGYFEPVAQSTISGRNRFIADDV